MSLCIQDSGYRTLLGNLVCMDRRAPRLAGFTLEWSSQEQPLMENPKCQHVWVFALRTFRFFREESSNLQPNLCIPASLRAFGKQGRWVVHSSKYSLCIWHFQAQNLPWVVQDTSAFHPTIILWTEAFSELFPEMFLSVSLLSQVCTHVFIQVLVTILPLQGERPWSHRPPSPPGSSWNPLTGWAMPSCHRWRPLPTWPRVRSGSLPRESLMVSFRALCYWGFAVTSVCIQRGKERWLYSFPRSNLEVNVSFFIKPFMFTDLYICFEITFYCIEK